ncbi:MAG: hypothetical protein RIS60_1034 [Pseudomonadota bacterium]
MTQHRWLACQKLEAFQIERLEGLVLAAAQPPPAEGLKNQEQVAAGLTQMNLESGLGRLGVCLHIRLWI